MSTAGPAHDLAALYQRHRGAMYGAAAAVLHPAGLPDDVDDAVQDAVLSIWESSTSTLTYSTASSR